MFRILSSVAKMADLASATVRCVRNTGSQLLRTSLLAGLFFVPVSLDYASAASCSVLERQLASLSGNSSHSRGTYSGAISEQKREIRRMERGMRLYRCTRKTKRNGNKAHPSCGRLKSTLKRMKSNLKSLEKQTGNGKSSRKNRRKRAKIIANMRKSNCGNSSRRQVSKGRTSILEQIFGRSSKNRRRANARQERDRLASVQRKFKKKQVVPTERRLKNYNTVRTMCVRTCDGYFFPVSFSTKQDSLFKDSNSCDSLCPGRNMELFYHKTSGETPEQMISSIDGRPYSELENAFAHQKSYNPSCSCNYRLLNRSVAENDVDLSDAVGDLIAKGRLKDLSIPHWRPDTDWKLATLTNPDAIAPIVLPTNSKNGSDNTIPAKTRVRVVGEAFLPAQ